MSSKVRNLRDLDPAEVAFVPQGANNKRFVVLKEGDRQAAAAVQQVRSPSPSMMEKITGVLKSLMGKSEDGTPGELSPEAQTALRATARILEPHKDEITDQHLDAVQEAVGIGAESGEDDDGEGTEGDGDVKPEHMKEAMGVAQKAYGAHMEKLGYKKYPKGEMAMKAMKPKTDEDDDDAQEEGEEDDTVAKQAIFKEDGSLNIEAIPDEMRPVVEHIMKAQVALQTRAQAAETRAEGLEKVLKENREGQRRAEIVRKAAEFKNLNPESVTKTLELADKSGKEEFDRVLKDFETVNAQLGAGKMFEEIGSGHANLTGGAGDAWSKIEKAAEGIVQKSAHKVTKEQAMAAFIETSEGQALYAQHQKSRKDGI